MIELEYFERACFFYKNGDYKKAMSLYDRYISVEDSTLSKAAGYYNIGVCCIKLSCFTDAIKFFKEALELRQESKYFYNLGYCCFKLEDYKKASLYFKTACSLDLDDVECQRALRTVEKKLKINKGGHN